MINLNSPIEKVSPQLNKINSSFLKFSLHYVPSNKEQENLSESYKNWNILLISRLMHFYYYNDKEVSKYCLKTIKEGIEIFDENLKILQNINKPLNLVYFWDQNKIKANEAYELLKKGVSLLKFENIKEGEGLVFLISVCDDRGGLKEWSTFPLIFETKAEVIETKITFALNQRVVKFAQSDYETVIEFISLANSYINFGFFVWNSKRNQVDLKMTFCYRGYSKENLLNLPKEIFNYFSTYKAYAKGLDHIYNKRNPANPVEIFNYCQRGLLENEDSSSFKIIEEIKLNKKITLQLRKKQYLQEKKIFEIISSREVLKETFQAENVIFIDKDRQIKYEFIEGKDLSKAIPYIKLPDMFEEFSKEIYEANLIFIKSPLEFLAVFEGKLIFCYKGSSLQSIVELDKNKTDYYDFMKSCFDYLEIYLCKIINKK